MTTFGAKQCSPTTAKVVAPVAEHPPCVGATITRVTPNQGAIRVMPGGYAESAERLIHG